MAGTLLVEFLYQRHPVADCVDGTTPVRDVNYLRPIKDSRTEMHDLRVFFTLYCLPLSYFFVTKILMVMLRPLISSFFILIH